MCSGLRSEMIVKEKYARWMENEVFAGQNNAHIYIFGGRRRASSNPTRPAFF